MRNIHLTAGANRESKAIFGFVFFVKVAGELRPALAAQAMRLSAAEAEADAARDAIRKAERAASADAAALSAAQNNLRHVDRLQ